MSEPSLEVAILDAAAADDAELMSAITTIINDVYAVAEHGLWTEGAKRTTVEEVQAITRAGQLVVARAGATIAGSVRIQRLGPDLSEFGMLAVAFDHRSTGVGRQLVEFVEQRSRDAGHTTMQLELLVPREWTHPSKAALDKWYSRIGYRRVRTGVIDEAYPQLAPLLATPCDFAVYHKQLGA
jgi:GNAT superfamily N-acetyltransferase